MKSTLPGKILRIMTAEGAAVFGGLGCDAVKNCF